MIGYVDTLEEIIEMLKAKNMGATVCQMHHNVDCANFGFPEEETIDLTLRLYKKIPGVTEDVTEPKKISSSDPLGQRQESSPDDIVNPIRNHFMNLESTKNSIPDPSSTKMQDIIDTLSEPVTDPFDEAMDIIK